MMLPLFPESLLLWLLPFAALLLAGFLALPGRSCPMHSGYRASGYRAKVYDKYASPYYLQPETVAILAPIYVKADGVQFNQVAKDTVLILKELEREKAQVIEESLTGMAAS